MKDREQRLGMADRLSEFEQTPREPEQFVIEAITDVGGAVARWSVRPATKIDRDLLVKNPAEALSQVEPDDPSLIFSESDITSANPEILPLAASLLVGKARRVEEDIPLSPREKSALKRFEDKVLEGTTKILAGIGGKRAVTGISTLTLLATACSSAINPPLPEPTPTEVPVASSTEIAPSPTEETESIVVISQRLMTGEEVFAAGGEELRQAYLDFQEEVKLREGLDNASFEAWGIETKTIDGGSIVSPFFEVNDPEQGNSLSMVIQLEAGGFRAIALEPLEVIVDGKTYLTLSLTKNAETLENLLTPEPIFWIPVSLAEWNAMTQEQRASLSVMFNGLGGIVTETQPLDGGKVAAIRAVMTPTITPEVSPTPEISELPPDLETYDQGVAQIWLNPEFSLGGSLQISADGATKFSNFLYDMFSRSDVYDGILGATPEEVKDYLINNNGLLPSGFKIPRPLPDSIENVRFVNAENRVDLKKPVEFRFYWEGEFPEEQYGIGLWVSNSNEPGQVGVAMEVKNDGGLLLHLIVPHHPVYSSDPEALVYQSNVQVGWLFWMYNSYNGSTSDFRAFTQAFNQVNSLSRNYVDRLYGFVSLSE